MDPRSFGPMDDLVESFDVSDIAPLDDSRVRRQSSTDGALERSRSKTRQPPFCHPRSEPASLIGPSPLARSCVNDSLPGIHNRRAVRGSSRGTLPVGHVLLGCRLHIRAGALSDARRAGPPTHDGDRHDAVRRTRRPAGRDVRRDRVRYVAAATTGTPSRQRSITVASRTSVVAQAMPSRPHRSCGLGGS